MKKSFLKVFTAIVFAAVATSCGSGLGKLAMDSPEAVNKVKEIVTTNVSPEEWKIVELSWSEGIGSGKLENNLNNGSVFVKMVKKNGRVFTQSFIGELNWKPSEIAPDSWYDKGLDFEKVVAVDATKLDATAIMKQLEEAKKLIPAEYAFKSLAEYRIESDITKSGDKYNPNLMTTFTVNVVEKGNETVSNAGSTSIVYYEIKFDVAPDGSVTMKE